MEPQDIDPKERLEAVRKFSKYQIPLRFITDPVNILNTPRELLEDDEFDNGSYTWGFNTAIREINPIIETLEADPNQSFKYHTPSSNPLWPLSEPDFVDSERTAFQQGWSEGIRRGMQAILWLGNHLDEVPVEWPLAMHQDIQEANRKYQELIDSWDKEYQWPVRNHRGHRLERGKWLGYPEDDNGDFIRDEHGGIVGPNYSDTLTGMDLSVVDGKVGKTMQCYTCGEEVGLHLTRAGYVRANTACEYADGISTKFVLSVPSGTMAVGNDFRGLEGWRGDPSEEWWHKRERTATSYMLDPFYVNTAMGCVNTALWYADLGLAHAFVGNTMPGFYKHSDELYTIANPDYDDEYDEKPYDGERLTVICTDLWWYSICDGDEYVKRGGKIPSSPYYSTEIIDVVPGLYEFTHHYHEGDFDRDGPGETVFTTIKLIERY